LRYALLCYASLRYAYLRYGSLRDALLRYASLCYAYLCYASSPFPHSTGKSISLVRAQQLLCDAEFISSGKLGTPFGKTIWRFTLVKCCFRSVKLLKITNVGNCAVYCYHLLLLLLLR